MDFKNKYLKYKIKYLELKNQIGGELQVKPMRLNSKSIKINFLPPGTTLEHLIKFLQSCNIPVVGGHHYLPTMNFVINFLDYDTANLNHDHVIIALTNPTPYNPYKLLPLNVAPSAKASVPKARPDYTRPWDSDSKILYIALPIAQKSDIGKEIHSRFCKMGVPSPFTNFTTSTRLTSPHISLFQLYIPTDSNLDELLSNPENFANIASIITDLFKDTFRINESESLQLHSQLGDYKMLSSWLARTYVDDKYLPKVVEHNYTPFRVQLRHILLKNLHDFPPGQFTSKITEEVEEVEEVVQAVHYASGSRHIPFTHYSRSPHRYPSSEMAIPSYYIESWTPHISLSLIGKDTNPEDFITKIKDAATNAMSYINLWPVDKKKTIPEIRQNRQGSLEYIYCTYGKNFIYKKI